MNSGGIGLLVTLLVRAQRQRQRVLAYGLSDHYRQIFELTRLDEAIGIHDSEDEALAAAGDVRTAARRRHAEAVGRAASRTSTSPTCPTARSTSTSTGAGCLARSRASGRCGRRPTGCGCRPTASRPTELIATWKQRFPEFWPDGNRFYAPLTGIEPGEVALLNMTLPGRMKLSTGRDGALRRRGVVHPDDAAGPHVRRLDHVQRDRARATRPSPRRRC